MRIIKRTPQILGKVDTVLINGGNFVNDKGNAYYKAPIKPLDILYEHIAPGALLDSSERFDPPKCDPDIRAATIQIIMDWIQSGDDSSPSILWLHGPAASGKSALGQSIAELCKRKGLLAAAFFFSRNASTLKKSDGKLLIATLVHQLTSTFPQTRPYIQKSIQNNESIFDRNIEAQAENLFILPAKKLCGSLIYFLQNLFFNSKHPRLILVDGLDECNDPNMQIDILRALAKCARELGYPFRFLIASRPESHICQTFNHDPLLATARVTRLDLVDGLDTAKDIRAYLCSEFKKITDTHRLRRYIPTSWPAEGAIKMLVDRSSGQFIYASTIMKYIQSRGHRPIDRLQVVLALSAMPANETPYASLDALYTHIFLSQGDNLPRVMQIFRVLVIPRSSTDGLGTFNTPEMLDKLLFFRPGDTELILSDLLSIVKLDSHNSAISLHHASLSDFLLDPTRSKNLSVDLGYAHQQLARGYMALLENVPLHDTQQFDAYLTPFLRNYDKATFSADLLHSLECLDFTSIYDRFSARFTPNIPEFISKGIIHSDFEAMESFWKIRSCWKSRGMEQLLRPFTRKEIQNDIHERILNRYMQTLYADYCPLDSAIKEALDSLLCQPRFQDYIFRMCDHVDHALCHRCQRISPLAPALSYRLLYTFMLYQPTIHHGGLYNDEGTHFEVRCAQRAYVCLAFICGIVDAVVSAHNRTAGATRMNNKREAIKARSQLESTVDFYFEASLDCATILLSYSDYSRSSKSLVDLVTKMSAEETLASLDEVRILRGFGFQFKALQSEIIAYLQRVEMLNAE